MAYYCLHKFHWSPSKFISLPKEEKAFVAAAIGLKIKQEDDEMKKMKSKSSKKKR